MTKDYIGRFAPSPTGLLHAGSLVAALASPFIDAKAHHGQWLIRIEDVDESRCKKEWAEGILNVLRQLQMNSDARSFGKAKEKTDTQKSFSHSSILTELRLQLHTTQYRGNQRQKGLPTHYYPGICRNGPHGPIRAWRFLTDRKIISFTDRWFGDYSQNVEETVGDLSLSELMAYLRTNSLLWSMIMTAMLPISFEELT